MSSSKDLSRGVFAGTEHYKERVEERTVVADEGYVLTSVAHHRINPYDYRKDVFELCDHIEWQQCHIEALDIALRASGERREALEKQAEDLQKKNEQAWERAALEARRVLKNGSKARKLEKQVEDQDKEIERLREALRYVGDFDPAMETAPSWVKGRVDVQRNMYAFAVGAMQGHAREALEKVSTASPERSLERSLRTESSEEKP